MKNKEIKSISFDFWNTLYTSNPIFIEKRLILLKDYNINIEEAISSMKLYKQTLEQYNKQGIHYYRDHYIEELFRGKGLINVNSYIHNMNKLFLKYPPIPIYKGLEEDILNIKKNYNIYISSNTGHIHGDILSRFIFDNLEIINNNCKFSDVIGVSKPSKDMFFNVDIHVGDTDETDGKCIDYGIEYYKIDKNHTIKSFINEKGILI